MIYIQKGGGPAVCFLYHFGTATLGLGDIEKDYKIIQSGEITIR